MARLKQIQRVREEIYQKLLLYPSLTPTKIAEEFGVSRSFVSGLKAKSLRANDHNLMETSTGLFLTEFQICQDRLNSYITELENLKKTQKRIVVDKLIELQTQTTDPNQAQRLRLTLKNLIMPDEGMGSTFKVLVQGKGVGNPELTCARKIRDIGVPPELF
jgi:hypothetical protein